MAGFDWRPAKPDPAHDGMIYGLPVVPTKLFGKDGFIVMAHRPYKDLTPSALDQLLSTRLSAGRKATEYFDNPSSLWTGTARSSTGTTSTTSFAGRDVETVFRVGADGRPEAVTRLVEKPAPGSVRNAGESDLAWLNRRVNEICWSPA